MRLSTSLLLLSALASAPLAGQKKAEKKGDKNKVELPAEHVHPSGTFTFRTPAGWSVKPRADRPEVLEASGDGLKAWFYFRPQEIGLDSLHVTCMEMRLLGPMDTSLDVKYEHDFIGGELGERKVLESAFEVSYEKDVDGAKQWRQRNITIVGLGQSLCVSSHAPKPLWRKTATKKLLDAVVASVSFR